MAAHAAHYESAGRMMFDESIASVFRLSEDENQALWGYRSGSRRTCRPKCRPGEKRNDVRRAVAGGLGYAPANVQQEREPEHVFPLE